jgi:hypothetical protein
MRGNFARRFPVAFQLELLECAGAVEKVAAAPIKKVGGRSI